MFLLLIVKRACAPEWPLVFGKSFLSVPLFSTRVQKANKQVQQGRGGHLYLFPVLLYALGSMSALPWAEPSPAAASASTATPNTPFVSSLHQKGCGPGWRRQPPSIILCCDTWLVAPEPLGVMSLLAATQKPERSFDLLCSTSFISSTPWLLMHLSIPVFLCASV